MPIIDVDHKFKKNYDKRIKNNSALRKKLKERIDLFSKNPKEPVLKNHKLTGSRREQWAFSVTGDYRVVYFWKNEKIVTLVDVGTHNQVYGK